MDALVRRHSETSGRATQDAHTGRARVDAVGLPCHSSCFSADQPWRRDSQGRRRLCVDGHPRIHRVEGKRTATVAWARPDADCHDGQIGADMATAIREVRVVAGCTPTIAPDRRFSQTPAPHPTNTTTAVTSHNSPMHTFFGGYRPKGAGRSDNLRQNSLASTCHATHRSRQLMAASIIDTTLQHSHK